MWPELEYESWRPTREALHLYLQMVGKYRLARTPWQNHSWHAVFYVTGRGVTTSLVPDGDGGIEISFDLVGHAVRGQATGGMTASFALEPMSVAEFHRRLLQLIRTLGGTPELNGRPSELPDAIPFADDRRPRPYDAAAVGRYFGALVAVDAVMKRFRTSFLGKSSPVHLFWGAMDLAVTRFSGRRAPPHPGGVPGLPDAVSREAYSHEVASCGFWPGDPQHPEAAFYAYAYPEPDGYRSAAVDAPARYDQTLGEFILPYAAVRASDDPSATLMRFFDSTYQAAADLGKWDRAELDCAVGVPLRPRPI